MDDDALGGGQAGFFLLDRAAAGRAARAAVPGSVPCRLREELFFFFLFFFRGAHRLFILYTINSFLVFVSFLCPHPCVVKKEKTT